MSHLFYSFMALYELDLWTSSEFRDDPEKEQSDNKNKVKISTWNSTGEAFCRQRIYLHYNKTAPFGVLLAHQ